MQFLFFLYLKFKGVTITLPAESTRIYSTINIKFCIFITDLTGTSDTPISRRKSFKKSLRESFRRLRRRRSERRKAAEEKAKEEKKEYSLSTYLVIGKRSIIQSNKIQFLSVLLEFY